MRRRNVQPSGGVVESAESGLYLLFREMQTDGKMVGNENGFEVDADDRSITVVGSEDLRARTISREVLQAILEFVPVAVYVKDPDGRYMFLNRKARKGLSKDGRNPLGLLDKDATQTDEQYSSYRPKELRCMEDQKIIPAHERWTDVHNHHHVSRVLNIPFVDSQQRTVGLVAITQDITHEASVRQARNLVSILRHDWVQCLITGVLAHLDLGQESSTSSTYDVSSLKKAFEFMLGYLDNLASFLDEYPAHRTKEFSELDFATDVVSYMRELAPLIGVRVTLKSALAEPVRLTGDKVCLRIMCFEMMRNHLKYGTGSEVVISAREHESDSVKLCFISPGQRHRNEAAYRRMFLMGERFTVMDENGLPKRPTGIGAGLHFCSSLTLAHNRLSESIENQYLNQIYGVEYSEELQANVFWFKFPTRKLSTT